MGQAITYPNIANLKRMVDHLNVIKEDKTKLFSMEEFFEGMGDVPFEELFECNSVSCVIGHCMPLHQELFVMLYNDAKVESLHQREEILRGHVYGVWSEHFTGIKAGSKFWHWCFGAEWTLIPEECTIEAAIDRINAFITTSYESHRAWTKFDIQYRINRRSELEPIAGGLYRDPARVVILEPDPRDLPNYGTEHGANAF